MPADEQINLNVTASTGDAQKNLSDLLGSLEGLGGAFKDTQKTAKQGSAGLGGLMGVAKQFYSSASMGASGVQGLVNVLGAINPVAGTALNGILKLAGALSQFKEEAKVVLGQAQNLTISLESLAARELVKAGEFENATEAMDTAQVAAQGLLREIQLLGLESPFENSLVVQTFKQGMAYGFASDQAMRLTRASLDMAAGLGLSGYEMNTIGMVMGQIRSTGKLMAQDLNQLRSRGINLADMLKDDLGVSVEQFNEGLKTGEYTMDDLLDVFARFASTNFAGAGQRMARTFQGIKSTLQDLKETAITTLLKRPFDDLTAVMADGLDVLSQFVTESGVLEKAGARIAAVTGRLAEFARTGISFFRYLLTAAMDGDVLNDWLTHLPAGLRNVAQAMGEFFAGDFRAALQDAAGWLRMIWANTKQIGDAVWAFIKPAFDWLGARLANIDWSPMVAHLRDTVNAVGQIIYSLVETIRRILTGNADTAFNPLRQAIVYTLTWIVTTWDRFGADAVQWGWNLVVQIANGIVAAARSVLQTAMNFLGNMIGLFLKPGSPPKKGPLSHIVEWGRGVINTYVQAFKTADFGLLRESLSPIKAALQDAVSAGTISEAEFPEIFKSVREDVALLISEFRKTGDISEDVLGGIGEKLGEGGEELTKYLRLQLQFQKAQGNLAKISEEVAKAEQAGFVPQALKQKLKAAQDAAGAAKDELDWQKEYLNLQKDSVDIQLQLVKALERLNDSLSRGAAKATGKGKAAKGSGAGAMPTAAPFTSTLMSGLDVGSLTGGAGEIERSIRGVSDEFRNARRRVEDFLNTPLSTHIRTIVDKLEEATGLDFGKVTGFFDTLRNLSWRDVIQGVGQLASGAWEALLASVPTLMQSAGRFFGILWQRIMEYFQINGPAWGAWLGNAFGRIGGIMFNLVTTQIPVFLGRVIAFLLKIIGGAATWLVTEAPRLAAAWIEGFARVVLGWLGLIEAESPQWLESLMEFAKNFVLAFVLGFAENAPDWYVDLLTAAAEFVQTFKDGITQKWDMLVYLRDKVILWVSNILLQFTTWISRVTELGQKFIDKLKEGIDLAWDLATWIGGKISGMVDTLIEDAGELLAGLVRLGVTVVSKIKEGINFAWDLATWLGGKLSSWWDDLTSGANSGWLSKIVSAGGAVVENLKAGIKAAWENFKAWWRRLLDGLTGPLPGSEPKDPRSPLRNLAARGAAFVENFQAGLDLTDMNTRLRAQLAETRRLMQAAGVGLDITQSYTFGDMVFPNVRDGRDAGGIERRLSRITLEGKMTARTQGA